MAASTPQYISIYGRTYRTSMGYVLVGEDDMYRNPYLRNCRIYSRSYNSLEWLLDPNEVAKAESLYYREQRAKIENYVTDGTATMSSLGYAGSYLFETSRGIVYTADASVYTAEEDNHQKEKKEIQRKASEKEKKHSINIKKLYWARKVKDKDIKL